MLNFENRKDAAALVGRLFFSSLFIVYGYMGLVGFAGSTAYMAKQGLWPPALFATVAVIVELGGGLLMLVGYQTRWVALVIGLYVLIAALIAHTHFADSNQLSHFMKNMALIGGCLAFVANGAGAYSIDGSAGSVQR